MDSGGEQKLIRGAVMPRSRSRRNSASDGHDYRAARLRYAACLCQRSNRVGGVLERVEPGDNIEHFIGEGELLHVTLVEIAFRYTRPGNDQQRLRCSTNPGPASDGSGQLQATGSPSHLR